MNAARQGATGWTQWKNAAAKRKVMNGDPPFPKRVLFGVALAFYSCQCHYRAPKLLQRCVCWCVLVS